MVLLLATATALAQDAGWFADRLRRHAAWQQVAALKSTAPGRVEFWDCAECPEMVTIPAGSFVLGSPPREPGRQRFEGPQRPVVLGHALAVGKYEVTRGEYARFALETGRLAVGCHGWNGEAVVFHPARDWRAPGYEQGDAHPVVCVDWSDIQAYTAWLSAKTGNSYRLLSEAEWEYAARAGASTAYPWGDRSDQACRHANVWDRSVKAVYARAQGMLDCADHFVHTAPVGSFQPNAFGLHDMAGNVWEWTADCWNDSHDGAPSDGRARSAGDCRQRVVRGGSWSSYAALPRSAVRVRNSVDVPAHHVGFRLARAP